MFTAKSFAEKYSVDKIVAHGFLRGLSELGLATVTPIERAGKGRRELAYTLKDEAVCLLGGQAFIQEVAVQEVAVVE